MLYEATVSRCLLAYWLQSERRSFWLSDKTEMVTVVSLKAQATHFRLEMATQAKEKRR